MLQQPFAAIGKKFTEKLLTQNRQEIPDWKKESDGLLATYFRGQQNQIDELLKELQK